MILTGFFGLSNFRSFVSFSDLLLFRMPIVEIDLQYFVFKTSELVGESVSPIFVCVPLSKSFIKIFSIFLSFCRLSGAREQGASAPPLPPTFSENVPFFSKSSLNVPFLKI